MLDVVTKLAQKNDKKIVMVVADGVGGLAKEPGGKTELETANCPHLDGLAKRGISGLMNTVAPGITPGSGPGHLGLFGYDPLQYLIGRGALEATGIGENLGPNDVAIRCNFCTLDADGNISDRRAGRIPTDESTSIVKILNEDVQIDGVEVRVLPVMEHRFVVIFTAEGLGGGVLDTDPQKTGVPPLDPQPVGDCPLNKNTAKIAKEFYSQAVKILKDQPKANGCTMRGFSKKPDMPTFEEAYGLKAGAIAVYPMYRGLASLVGMETVGSPKSLEEEVETLRDNWDDYDFFFLHWKYTDSRGEDGDFDAKVKMIEELDVLIPAIEALGPDVLIVTADHSTPAKLASHSWHPVPVTLVAEDARIDPVQKFDENAAICGGLGQFRAVELMTLALAHADKLAKYGA